MSTVLILLIIFAFVFAIVKMGLEHEQEKVRLQYREAPDNSLKVSELHALIEEAVEEANAPLRERLAAMERELGRLEEAKGLPRGEREARIDPSLLEEEQPSPAGTPERTRAARSRTT